MRNTTSGTWATLVQDGRREAGLSQQALADLVGVDRTTVWRWERKDIKPDTVEMAEAVAGALGRDRAQAVRLAGFAMTETDTPAPDPRLGGLDPNDPVVRKIMSYEIDEDLRQVMLDRHRHNLARDRQRYLEDVERDLEVLRRRGAA